MCHRFGSQVLYGLTISLTSFLTSFRAFKHTLIYLSRIGINIRTYDNKQRKNHIEEKRTYLRTYYNRNRGSDDVIGVHDVRINFFRDWFEFFLLLLLAVYLLVHGEPFLFLFLFCSMWDAHKRLVLVYLLRTRNSVPMGAHQSWNR